MGAVDQVEGDGAGPRAVFRRHARLDLRGPLALADRWLQGTFNKTAERAAAGLRTVLGAHTERH